MSNISIENLSVTAQAKSDQLNSDDLLGGDLMITVTSVRIGTSDQPVIIGYEGDNGKPYKPCKSMRKVLIFAWGENGNAWIGKSMTLYNKKDVKFGGVEVGGIRISHMSDIQSDIKISLTATRGKKEPYMIKKLELSRPKAQPAQQKQEKPLSDRIKNLLTAFSSLGVTDAMIGEKIATEAVKMSYEQFSELAIIYTEIKNGAPVDTFFSVSQESVEEF